MTRVVGYRNVTDRQTDGRTDGHLCHGYICTALTCCTCKKIMGHADKRCSRPN